MATTKKASKAGPAARPKAEPQASPADASTVHRSKDPSGRILLNLGCGSNVLPGYINVDVVAGRGADVVADLDEPPWPFPSDSADEVLASHILEHVENANAFVMECARILKPGGKLVIYVPHWNHPVACWGNLDHKRIVHPHALRAFLPEGRNSSDSTNQGFAGSFQTMTWGVPRWPRAQGWGESKFLPGFLRIGKSRLGVFTHLFYRLRWRAALNAGEIEMVLTK